MLNTSISFRMLALLILSFMFLPFLLESQAIVRKPLLQKIGTLNTHCAEYPCLAISLIFDCRVRVKMKESLKVQKIAILLAHSSSPFKKEEFCNPYRRQG